MFNQRLHHPTIPFMKYSNYDIAVLNDQEFEEIYSKDPWPYMELKGDKDNFYFIENVWKNNSELRDYPKKCPRDIYYFIKSDKFIFPDYCIEVHILIFDIYQEIPSPKKPSCSELFFFCHFFFKLGQI